MTNVSVNVARAVGPALAGVVIALAGAGGLFWRARPASSSSPSAARRVRAARHGAGAAGAHRRRGPHGRALRALLGARCGP